MFFLGEIWAYPTDTSFGLGARIDDPVSLQRLFDLKKRASGKYFSLMVADEAMLWEYACKPEISNLKSQFSKREDFGLEFGAWSLEFLKRESYFPWTQWFMEKPRTAIFRPSDKLPKTPFWPEDKVAFRITTLDHVRSAIQVPITATSANLSGEAPLFRVEDFEKTFPQGQILIDTTYPHLPEVLPSEIWDFTLTQPKRIR